MQLPAIASKTSLMGVGLSFIVFLLLFAVTSFLWLFGLVFLGVAIGVAFSSSRLIIVRGDQYQVVKKYVAYEQPSGGAANSIIGFEAVPFNEETHLALQTQNGTVILARGLQAEEVNHLVAQGNRWLTGR